MKICWASDIHFDLTYAKKRQEFYESVKEFDLLLISGDIANGREIEYHLNNIKKNVSNFYFVLGNHDFYHSSFKKVRQSLSSYKNYLTNKSFISLKKGIALIGHDGWYDVRNGVINKILVADIQLIRELRLAQNLWDITGDSDFINTTFKKLALEAANHFKNNLNLAFKKHDKVFLITHVPPFLGATWYNGKISSEEYLPYYSSKIEGEYIIEVMEKHPDKELIVLCGHTHSGGQYKPLNNVIVYTAQAEISNPALQETVFDI